MYSFLVIIFVILNNPQITKARNENFKSEKINLNFFGLSMLVGISEAIRLLSTKVFLNLRNYILCMISINTMFKNNEIVTDTININLSNKKGSIKNDDNKFNEWLAGLIDGDGCFQLTKKGYASLEIVMEFRDKNCLYQIKQKFGGSVKLRAGYNHLRYRLHHKAGLLSLINAVNGLIRNPNRILQLGRICDKYNIKLIDTKPLTFDNGWFSGFFDSDGSIYMDDKSGQLFLTISQKNKFILEKLVELYGGTIYVMVKQDAFKWTCYRKIDILTLINNYFNVNPSRSEKRVRLAMVNRFYELRKLHAHTATPNSVLGKVWRNFFTKWEKIVK